MRRPCRDCTDAGARATGLSSYVSVGQHLNHNMVIVYFTSLGESLLGRFHLLVLLYLNHPRATNKPGRRTHRLVEFDLRAGVLCHILGKIFQEEKAKPLVENLLEFNFTRLFQILLHYTPHTENASILLG